MEAHDLAPKQPDVLLIHDRQPEPAGEGGQFLVGKLAADLEHHQVIAEACLVERRHAARQRPKAVCGKAERRPCACTVLTAASLVALLAAAAAAAATAARA